MVGVDRAVERKDSESLHPHKESFFQSLIFDFPIIIISEMFFNEHPDRI